MSKKIIAQIKCGLGNQLFIYAAARALALRNQAELVLDTHSGFENDFLYQRKYSLQHYHIAGREITEEEKITRAQRREFYLKENNERPFNEKEFLIQKEHEIWQELLTGTITDTVYFEGYWLSEMYFNDFEEIIRKDLTLKNKPNDENQRLAEFIHQETSVALHVRFFHGPEEPSESNMKIHYYEQAMQQIAERVENIKFFLFSDRPNEASKRLNLSKYNYQVVDSNQTDAFAYLDLWLMSQCQHFITANSTFSWWGAWLGTNPKKIVITPKENKEEIGGWGFEGLLPDKWVKI